MFKKIILASVASVVLAATSAVAFANDAPYIGGSLGINADDFKTTDHAGDKVDFSGRGAVGNIFAGYGATLTDTFYLGAEVFADLTSAESDIKAGTDSSKDTLEERYGYGISVIPGVMLSDHTLAYARAGIVRSNFKVKANNVTSSGTESNTLTGGQLGLGLQTSLTQNVDLRGEYDFTDYRSASFNTGGGNSIKVSPLTDSFTVGLVYKFD
ncbi:MAG: hypothetical protein A3F12_07350 [Gammaproteobacteria bacterium RIFCSPHIGHO2_12_FULL_38_14]|nr:MAG: hypothetical protein A3F12_07350 [Gammaproteobacteria bacterium RIFCSPHIGHO2_12_FULL_38_14]